MTPLSRLVFTGLPLLVLVFTFACSPAPDLSHSYHEKGPVAVQIISETSTPRVSGLSVEPSITPTTPEIAVTATSSSTRTSTLPPAEIVNPSATAQVPIHAVAPTATIPYTNSRVIGTSIEKREIAAHQFGTGPNHIIFVGGIHGGYEWNTTLLAYEAIEYFQEHPELVPNTITLTIIPSANPDGQFLVTGKDGPFTPEDVALETVEGRFNSNNVDLNRNWDCEWTEHVVWKQQAVSAGPEPFSERETQILRDFFLEEKPELVVFWHSAANGVFSAGCPDVDEDSRTIANIFGEAAGYPVFDKFDYYPVTGDAGDWLTTQGISSFTVELQNHENLDWPKNLRGIQGIIEAYR